MSAQSVEASKGADPFDGVEASGTFEWPRNGGVHQIHGGIVISKSGGEVVAVWKVIIGRADPSVLIHLRVSFSPREMVGGIYPTSRIW